MTLTFEIDTDMCQSEPMWQKSFNSHIIFSGLTDAQTNTHTHGTDSSLWTTRKVVSGGNKNYDDPNNDYQVYHCNSSIGSLAGEAASANRRPGSCFVSEIAVETSSDDGVCCAIIDVFHQLLL